MEGTQLYNAANLHIRQLRWKKTFVVLGHPIPPCNICSTLTKRLRYYSWIFNMDWNCVIKTKPHISVCPPLRAMKTRCVSWPLFACVGPHGSRGLVTFPGTLQKESPFQSLSPQVTPGKVDLLMVQILYYTKWMWKVSLYARPNIGKCNFTL